MTPPAAAAPTLPPHTTADVMRVPIKGTNRVIELDATRGAAGEVTTVALFQLVQSISGLSRTQTDDVIKELKVSKPHLTQVRLPPKQPPGATQSNPLTPPKATP